jgi:hypothetical protein
VMWYKNAFGILVYSKEYSFPILFLIQIYMYMKRL